MHGRIRPSWAEYAMNLAIAASTRSEDPYRQVGSVILGNDNETLGTGYNGFPPGFSGDWSDRENRLKYVVHAEVNCCKYIVPGQARLIAVTLSPCTSCVQTIAAYKIKTIVYKDIYERDSSGLDLAREFGIELIRIND